MNLFTLWGFILEYIKKNDPQYYEMFYKKIFPSLLDEKELTIITQDPYLVSWIEALYKTKLETIISEKLNKPMKIVILSKEDHEEKKSEKIPDFMEEEKLPLMDEVKPYSPPENILINIPKNSQDIVLPSIQNYSKQTKVKEKPVYKSPNPINTEHTFETFVHGNCNEMAFQSALSVAQMAVNMEEMDKKMNPLFIYGPSGLGKTHLLHAICNYIRENAPHLSYIFVSSETFTNELIASIKSNSMPKFREKYRNPDYLLIDDVQFFGSKNSSKMEIFNTFNTLFDNKKHIILTSDRTPSDIEELEDRIQTRFSSGLIVPISPPDYEICSIILEKRAEKEGINIPSEVINYIAEHINTNVRELDGAFNKLVTYAKVQKKEMTLEFAKETLKDQIPLEQNREITPEIIINTVCNKFNVKKENLLGKGRPKNIVIPRQIAMYLCRKELNLSFPILRDIFKRKDHSTILYACERVEKDIAKDNETKRIIEELSNMLKNIWKKSC